MHFTMKNFSIFTQISTDLLFIFQKINDEQYNSSTQSLALLLHNSMFTMLKDVRFYSHYQFYKYYFNINPLSDSVHSKSHTRLSTLILLVQLNLYSKQ